MIVPTSVDYIADRVKSLRNNMFIICNRGKELLDISKESKHFNDQIYGDYHGKLPSI